MPEKQKVSRLERMKADGIEPPLPEISVARYLLDFFFEVGPTMATAMGPEALTHQELRAWQKNLGLFLRPWEVRQLRRLSLVYVDESQRAMKSTAPPPWGVQLRNPSLDKKLDDFLN